MKAEAKIARERKFYLVLPAIALPFLTLLFWLLGGGTDAIGQQSKDEQQASLNTQLPGANNENTPKDKLSYYELADKDSAKFIEQMKLDTNYRQYGGGGYNGYGQSTGPRGYGDPMASRIYSGLNDLERQMQSGYSQRPSNWQDYEQYDRPSRSGGGRHREDFTAEYPSLTAQEQSESDPELDQLNSMLDKIMEIQNPELANERLKETTAKRRGQVFAVTTTTRAKQVTLLDDQKKDNSNGGFYELDNAGFTEVPQNTIRAVVHESQLVVNGSTVKMRLADEVVVNGIKIPKDNFIFGTAQLSGERLVIKIESLRYGRSLFPVDLAVYDLDGLDGIYIPGSITRDVVKQSADRPLQSLNLSAFEASWGAQAAGAGVEMVKGLFSKKTKLIKVRVKAGYQILLRDEKQKQNL